jgi:DDE superfamily endonuclease
MIPLLRTTLGRTGRRPGVGHRDGHDLGCRFGALDLGTGRLTTRPVARPRVPAKPTQARSRPRRVQAGLARHVRGIARAYPAAHDPRVVLVSDNAPWHRGARMTQALTACAPLALYRLPGSSPQLHVIEPCWRVLRRRATPNRRFLTLAQLTHALRHSLRSYQTLKQRGLSVIQSPTKRTQLSAA